jgi:NADH-quinone oxidoreductase subunit A
MEHLEVYLPIAIIIFLGVAFGVIGLTLSQLIGPKRPNPSKSLPYESGMVPIGEANVRLPIKFYMVSLLFLLFDVEAVYVLAWARVFNDKTLPYESDVLAFSQIAFQRFAFIEMLVFICILMLGYLYVWKKGGLRWS